MKRSTLWILGLFSFLSLAGFTNEAKAQQVSVNIGLFRSELSPYGRWMMHPRFGEVWLYNEPNFRPYYSNGYWDYTDYGWEWVSDYNWGWAPFHYGRWEYDPYYGGWMWIPGYEWAPAWVAWSEGGDYYGWAPLGFGASFNISIGMIGPDRWTFCNRGYIYDRSFRNYCAPFNLNINIFRGVRVVNNYYNYRSYNYCYGPNRYDAQRYCGRPIEVRYFDNRRYGPGRNNDVRFRNEPRGYAYGNRDYRGSRFENNRYDNDRRDYRGNERRDNDGRDGRSYERRDDDRRDGRDNDRRNEGGGNNGGWNQGQRGGNDQGQRGGGNNGGWNLGQRGGGNDQGQRGGGNNGGWNQGQRGGGNDQGQRGGGFNGGGREAGPVERPQRGYEGGQRGGGNNGGWNQGQRGGGNDQGQRGGGNDQGERRGRGRGG